MDRLNGADIIGGVGRLLLLENDGGAERLMGMCDMICQHQQSGVGRVDLLALRDVSLYGTSHGIARPRRSIAVARQLALYGCAPRRKWMMATSK